MSAILYDARGNEIKVGFPDMVTNETVTDARPITAVLGALNAEVILDLNGTQTVSFDMRTAAANLTVVFEGTLDGVNYTPLVAYVLFSNIAALLLAETFVASVTYATVGSGIYYLEASGLRRVRVRVSAYTSGTLTVACRGSSGEMLVVARPVPSTLHVTVTAAANTAATITLPNALIPGLFHYITNIHIMRNATAALVGGATLIITSTNLPGNPAWSVGNAMVAGGTQLDLNYSPTTPLKSSVASTPTTIVMPAAGAAVLWRGNCTYYVGA